MKKTILSGLVLLALPLSAAMAQSSTFEMVPGVMVDRSADALYLMRPGGGIEKVSVASGSVSWTSDEADKPVGIQDGQLMAQAAKSGAGTQLELMLLNAASGTVAGELQVDLPEGVIAGIDDGLGRQFSVRGLATNGAPKVIWEHTERYSGGARPEPGQPLVTRKEAAYRVDMQASRLVEIDPALARAPAPALPTEALAWSAKGTAAEPPAVAGAVIAATDVIGGSTTPESQVLLKRWDDSGQPLPDVELFSGPHVLKLRSADGLHLLVTDRAAPGTVNEYQWSVYSLETGEREGQLRHRQSHSRFFVSGRTLVLIRRPFGHLVNDDQVLEPRELHGVSLETGETLWTRPLRDTSFKGQVPR